MPRADPFRFLAATLRNPAKVGAIAPSSSYLAAAMLKGVDLSDDKAVIEFGPGTGPFTRAIANALPDRSRYLGIERDEKFVDLLRERHTDMQIVHGSAEDATQHATQAGFTPESIALILCGLPFASLPETVQRNVVDALDKLLTAGAQFRTFQYAHAWPMKSASRYRAMMSERFGPCQRSPVVLRNLPPAFVLKWAR